MTQTRRRFPESFKREAVDQVLAGTPLRHVAETLGIAENLLGKWTRQYEPQGAAAFSGSGKAAGRARGAVSSTPATGSGHHGARCFKKPSPRRSAAHWVRNTPTTLTPLDSGRLLFGGSVPVKKPDPGEAADPLVVARFVTPFRNVI